jgi:hypothetical protein
VAERKAFLLRIDPALLEAMQRWAADELRSVNGQIEFVLRRALQREGRGPGGETARPGASEPKDD